MQEIRNGSLERTIEKNGQEEAEWHWLTQSGSRIWLTKKIWTLESKAERIGPLCANLLATQ